MADQTPFLPVYLVAMTRKMLFEYISPEREEKNLLEAVNLRKFSFIWYEKIRLF
jgi:hypothetical protein